MGRLPSDANRTFVALHADGRLACLARQHLPFRFD
jgi:hypothetical protein